MDGERVGWGAGPPATGWRLEWGAAPGWLRDEVEARLGGGWPNPDSPRAHRAEARNMGLLPRSAPAPRLLWSLDRHGWVALAYEDVDGAHPALPWRPAELHRVLEMVAAMAAALTPAPAGIPPVGESLQDSFVGWCRLAAAHPVAAGADPLAVTTALAAFAGFLLGGARLPDPPGLPTLRAFQLGQGLVALDWLRRRTGWT